MNRFLPRLALTTIALLPLCAASAAAQSGGGLYVPQSEPSAVSKFSSSVKNGFSKVTDALVPKSAVKEASDPISLSVPAKPSAEFHVAVARMAEQSGDIIKAEQHYRKALHLSPGHFDASMNYAHMLDRQGKLGQAAQHYRTAVQTRPSNPTAHNDLAICCARQGNLVEAVASLEKAVQLNPKQPRYRNNVATILVQMKRIDEAYSHLKAVHPEAVACYNLGYLVQKSGDPQGAARLFERALAVNPSLTQARAWLNQLRQSTPASAKRPQTVAQRPAARAPAIPSAGSAAPLPPQTNLRHQPAATNNSPPRQLAPLPSIKPLPPVRGR